MYNGYYVYDYTLHFYFLGGPDFVVGPDAPPSERNVLGVIKRVGLDIAKGVIKHRAYGQRITAMLGGKATHPTCGLLGGVSKPITEEERLEIERMAESSVEFAKFTPSEYLDNIEEHVEEWTYVKQPYLKKVGWKGFADGPESGIYRVGPLARLNASEGMSTPLANDEYKRMYETLGGKPVHSTLAYHWARLIELLNAAERTLELSRDPEITSTKVRNKPSSPGEGVGIIEAARGTLIHHYKLDDEALVEDVNPIVATTNNAPAINMSIRDAARSLIHDGEVGEGLLNMVEMAFRAYDPCFACATHFAVGQMPLTVNIYDHQKRLLRTVKR